MYTVVCRTSNFLKWLESKMFCFYKNRFQSLFNGHSFFHTTKSLINTRPVRFCELAILSLCNPSYRFFWHLLPPVRPALSLFQLLMDNRKSQTFLKVSSLDTIIRMERPRFNFSTRRRTSHSRLWKSLITILRVLKSAKTS